MLTRRHILAAAATLPLLGNARIPATWNGLIDTYRAPDWFRDAKFGIWSHWSAQCVPEFGDWYGRQMYIQGNPFYEHHVRTYGHPSETGFMEIENRWTAAHWDPVDLVDRFRKAGARYIVSLANHHDNLDCYNSAHHAWNTMRVGPRRDIVGIWEKAVRARGLRFGVSNHASHAWHWWQTAYGYDAEGPRRGIRYDAFGLTAADGRGRWWEGLDPQELYTGAFMAPPDGIATIAAMNAWHDARDGQWIETVPPGPRGLAYAHKWLRRQQDLVAKYRPDLCYFDNHGLPFGQIGLDAVADYYNRSLDWHGGIDVVLTAKALSADQRRGIVEDVERGYLAEIRPEPWQTCTCIGNWHYDRALYERRGYVPAKGIVQRLCDVVSKNGNLLLSVPQRGDGTIDSEEDRILADLARWFAVNGDAIHGTRPWHRFGEGPSVPPTGMQSEAAMQPYSAADVRFTTGGGGLNAFLLEWPIGEARIASLGTVAGRIEHVRLLGGGPLRFVQEAGGLRVTMPPAAPDAVVPCLRIEGHGLV